MTEHEMLKEICDKIGFNTEHYWEYTSPDKSYLTCTKGLDVREIIFRPEFMDKYSNYVINSNDIEIIYKNQNFESELLCNLNDPVSYLAKQLWIWTK